MGLLYPQFRPSFLLPRLLLFSFGVQPRAVSGGLAKARNTRSLAVAALYKYKSRTLSSEISIADSLRRLVDHRDPMLPTKVQGTLVLNGRFFEWLTSQW